MPCVNCQCCFNIKVTINAFEAVRLKRALRIEFAQFVKPIKRRRKRSHPAVRLGTGSYDLDLRKSRRYKGGCTFLIGFADGRTRCGVYADRPDVCAVYPMHLRHNAVQMREDARCKSREWDLAGLDRAWFGERLAAFHADWDRFDGMVEAWNASEPVRAGRGTADGFYRFIEAAVDAAAAHPDLPVAELCAPLLG